MMVCEKVVTKVFVKDVILAVSMVHKRAVLLGLKMVVLMAMLGAAAKVPFLVQ